MVSVTLPTEVKHDLVISVEQHIQQLKASNAARSAGNGTNAGADGSNGSDSPDVANALNGDSRAYLPPPDVAKTIPCRYFPNCHYGAKCLFLHPTTASNTVDTPSLVDASLTESANGTGSATSSAQLHSYRPSDSTHYASTNGTSNGANFRGGPLAANGFATYPPYDDFQAVAQAAPGLYYVPAHQHSASANGFVNGTLLSPTSADGEYLQQQQYAYTTAQPAYYAYPGSAANAAYLPYNQNATTMYGMYAPQQPLAPQSYSNGVKLQHYPSGYTANGFAHATDSHSRPAEASMQEATGQSKATLSDPAIIAQAPARTSPVHATTAANASPSTSDNLAEAAKALVRSTSAIATSAPSVSKHQSASVPVSTRSTPPPFARSPSSAVFEPVDSLASPSAIGASVPLPSSPTNVQQYSAQPNVNQSYYHPVAPTTFPPSEFLHSQYYAHDPAYVQYQQTGIIPQTTYYMSPAPNAYVPLSGISSEKHLASDATAPLQNLADEASMAIMVNGGDGGALTTSRASEPSVQVSEESIHPDNRNGVADIAAPLRSMQQHPYGAQVEHSRQRSQSNSSNTKARANGHHPRSSISGGSYAPRNSNGFADRPPVGKPLTRSDPNLPCSFFDVGKCRYGDGCHFAHYLTEPRQMPSSDNKGDSRDDSGLPELVRDAKLLRLNIGHPDGRISSEKPSWGPRSYDRPHPAGPSSLRFNAGKHHGTPGMQNAPAPRSDLPEAHQSRMSAANASATNGVPSSLASHANGEDVQNKLHKLISETRNLSVNPASQLSGNNSAPVLSNSTTRSDQPQPLRQNALSNGFRGPSRTNVIPQSLGRRPAHNSASSQIKSPRIPSRENDFPALSKSSTMERSKSNEMSSASGNGGSDNRSPDVSTAGTSADAKFATLTDGNIAPAKATFSWATAAARAAALPEPAKRAPSKARAPVPIVAAPVETSAASLTAKPSTATVDVRASPTDALPSAGHNALEATSLASSVRA